MWRPEQKHESCFLLIPLTPSSFHLLFPSLMEYHTCLTFLPQPLHCMPSIFS
jgi:hypothetical protein